MTKLALCILMCALVGSCGPTTAKNDPDGGGGDGPKGPHTLSSIVVTPTNPILELDLNTPGSQAFVATGVFQDGVDEDLTSQVAWSVDNAAVGAMNGPTLEIPGFPATGVQVGRITAKMGTIEGQAQITVVAYRRSGPQQDFFFVLPYEDPAGQVAKPLDFGTAIPSLDVFFLMDTTGSMGGEIGNLRNALTGTIIPGIQTEVPNTQFGVGAFNDFPISPYGSTSCGTSPAGDQPFYLHQQITDNVAAVQTATAKYLSGSSPAGCGNDWPEAMLEALYQVSTGEGLTGPAPTNVPAHTGGVGGVSFRPDIMPVIVTISDAQSHAPGETTTCPSGGVAYGAPVSTFAHNRTQTKTALGNICARSVGVSSAQAGLADVCLALNDLEDLARSTGTRVPPSAWDVGTRPAGCAAGQCCTNVSGTGRAPDADGLCPLVFRTDSNGSGLGAHIVTGIKMLTRFATFNATSERQGETGDIHGNPLPAPRTTADFIKAVMPTGSMVPPAPPVIPPPTFDATTFFNVTPGTRVQFDVRAFNDFVQQTADAQIFRAGIRVLAGGCTALDQRDVLILVPPTPIVIQ